MIGIWIFFVSSKFLLYPFYSQIKKIQTFLLKKYGFNKTAPHLITQYSSENINEVLANRWTGSHVTIEWPARSPDLTPLHFFLYGYSKTEVNKHRLNMVEDLKNAISAEIRQINSERIRNMQDELVNRLGY